jgi:hypothetical protein
MKNRLVSERTTLVIAVVTTQKSDAAAFTGCIESWIATPKATYSASSTNASFSAF